MTIEHDQDQDQAETPEQAELSINDNVEAVLDTVPLDTWLGGLGKYLSFSTGPVHSHLWDTAIHFATLNGDVYAWNDSETAYQGLARLPAGEMAWELLDVNTDLWESGVGVDSIGEIVLNGAHYDPDTDTVRNTDTTGETWIWSMEQVAEDEILMMSDDGFIVHYNPLTETVTKKHSTGIENISTSIGYDPTTGIAHVAGFGDRWYFQSYDPETATPAAPFMPDAKDHTFAAYDPDRNEALVYLASTTARSTTNPESMHIGGEHYIYDFDTHSVKVKNSPGGSNQLGIPGVANTASTSDHYVGVEYSGGDYYVWSPAGLHKFDPVNLSYTALTAPPATPAVGDLPVSAGSGGELYFAVEGATTIYKYDVSGDSWSTITGERANCMTTLNGDLYVHNSGGLRKWTGSTWDTTLSNSGLSPDWGQLVGHSSGDIFAFSRYGDDRPKKYDTATDTWTAVGSGFPPQIGYNWTELNDGKLYDLGSPTSFIGIGTVLQPFNPSTGEWEPEYEGPVVVADHPYQTGGASTDHATYFFSGPDSLGKLDHETKTISVIPDMPMNMDGYEPGGMFIRDGIGYVMANYNTAQQTYPILLSRDYQT